MSFKKRGKICNGIASDAGATDAGASYGYGSVLYVWNFPYLTVAYSSFVGSMIAVIIVAFEESLVVVVVAFFAVVAITPKRMSTDAKKNVDRPNKASLSPRQVAD